MKKSLIILLLSAVAVIDSKLYAQALSLRENNLDKSKNLSVVLSPVGTDVYNQNFNLFAEAKLMYRLKKEYGWLTAHYKIAYLDRLEENIFVDAISGTQPLKDIGATLAYNFIRKEKIQIATPAFYSRRNKIRLPVTFLRTYGAHVGYSQFRTIFATGSSTSYMGEITVAAVTKTMEVTATPMLNATILHAGIHRQWLEDYIIDSNNGSGSSTKGKSITTLYADFMYAPLMKIEQVYVPLGENAPNSIQNYNGRLGPFDYNYYPLTIQSPRTIPVGARIGVDITHLSTVGYHYALEFGFRPGVSNPTENLFFLMKLGFSINAKVK